jgi:hypothetical protein
MRIAHGKALFDQRRGVAGGRKRMVRPSAPVALPQDEFRLEFFSGMASESNDDTGSLVSIPAIGGNGVVTKELE